MRVFFIGDIVGQAGCEFVRKKLSDLKRSLQIDVVIANGENSAEGNGVLPLSAQYLFDSGVDVITSGNHALRRREIYEYMDNTPAMIRPANYHPTAPGRGSYLYDAVRAQLCVINLQGVVYMNSLQSPFDCVDELLSKISTPNIIVDFHAEATAEKQALAHYLDGKVSAVIGTHTHVQTADARILPQGTGYLTDAGMCGGMNSILGVKKESAIFKMRTGLPVKFVNDTKDLFLNGVFLDIEPKTGKCTKIETITCQ